MKESTAYFMAMGALGIGAMSYFAYTRLQTPKIDFLTPEKTGKILQVIKHQMLITCINFTSEIDKRMAQVNFSDPQTIYFLRKEMGKIY